MRIKEGFTLREIAGEQVIMPTGKNISKFDGAVSLNEVSAFIYNTIDADPGISQEELTLKITDEYEVSAETAEADSSRIVDELAGYGIVEK